MSDFEDIDDWLKREAPFTASKWLNGMLDSVQSLEENPHRCAYAIENGSVELELRQLLYGKYRIV